MHLGVMVIRIMYTNVAEMSAETDYLLTEIDNYLADALCLSPPWFVILLSKSTRDECLKLVGCYRENAVQIFVSSSMNV
uniref:Uncharacterized protein n=1 Tax=Acrobeloides nanus TaxID=290746 RepID=A0A914ER39_9BILA